MHQSKTRGAAMVRCRCSGHSIYLARTKLSCSWLKTTDIDRTHCYQSCWHIFGNIKQWCLMILLAAAYLILIQQKYSNLKTQVFPCISYIYIDIDIHTHTRPHIYIYTHTHTHIYMYCQWSLSFLCSLNLRSQNNFHTSIKY